MKSSGQPGVLSGLSVAAMVTAALIGTLFFGWKVVGLPFVPFDAFDGLTRVLPGRMIAFGIGTMVMVIRALNLGPTSETAKLAEQMMAIAGLFITAVLGGAILFCIVRGARRRYGAALGLALGIVLGIPAVLVSLQASQPASLAPWVRAVWVLGTFLIWGAVLGRAEQRLVGEYGAAVVAADEVAVEQIDRRRFLVRHQFITLSCISNPVGGDLIGTTRWTGVSLQGLLPDLRLKPGATHLKIRAADQFYEVVSLEAIKRDERIMLAHSWDGVPLTRDHGSRSGYISPTCTG